MVIFAHQGPLIFVVRTSLITHNECISMMYLNNASLVLTFANSLLTSCRLFVCSPFGDFCAP